MISGRKALAVVLVCFVGVIAVIFFTRQEKREEFPAQVVWNTMLNPYEFEHGVSAFEAYYADAQIYEGVPADWNYEKDMDIVLVKKEDFNGWEQDLFADPEAYFDHYTRVKRTGHDTLICDICAFSPNGEWISFWGHEASGYDSPPRALFVADMKGDYRQITDYGSQWGWYAFWSADTTISYLDHEENEIVSYDVESGEEARISVNQGMRFWYFSPGEAVGYIMLDNFSVVTYDLGDQVVRPISEEDSFVTYFRRNLNVTLYDPYKPDETWLWTCQDCTVLGYDEFGPHISGYILEHEQGDRVAILPRGVFVKDITVLD